MKKDDSRVLSAVGAVLQVVVQCLDRSPEARLKSNVLEERLTNHIIRFAGIDPLHCVYLAPESARPTRSQQQRHIEERLPEPTHLDTRARRTRTPIPELDEASSVDMPLSPERNIVAVRPSTSRTATRPTSPPVVFLDSLSSLHFDADSTSMRSDTVVARSGTSRSATSRDQSIYSPPSEQDISSYPPDIQKWHNGQGPNRWDIDLSSDSNMDPRTARARHGTEPGAFTYINYSTSPSSDDDGLIFHYPLPPTSPPPKKNLPPVPARHELRDWKPVHYPPYTKYHHDPPPVKHHHQHLHLDSAQEHLHASKALPSTHPARQSSLTRDEKAQRERAYVSSYDKHPHSHPRQQPQLSPVGRHIAEQERVYRHRI